MTTTAGPADLRRRPVDTVTTCLFGPRNAGPPAAVRQAGRVHVTDAHRSALLRPER